MKKLLLLLFIACAFIVKAQTPTTIFDEYITDSLGNKVLKEFFVNDRFGNKILFKDIIKNSGGQSIQLANTCIASSGNGPVFELTFEDMLNNTGVGFADPTPGTILATLGDERQAVACQVFTDISAMLVAANDPYTVTSTNNPQQRVRIVIRSSATWSGTGAEVPATLGYASPFFYDHLAGSPRHRNSATYNNYRGLTYGSVWEAINSGFDPWFGFTYNNFGNPPLNPAYHGLIKMNFINHTFYNGLSNSITAGSSDHDLYSVMLHEAIHSLGFLSLLNQNGTSKLTNQNNIGPYSLYDTYLTDVVTGNTLLQGATGQLCGVEPNPALIGDYIATCSVNFSGANNTCTPEATPITYSSGTTLSHFDNGCAGNGCGALQDYVMLSSLPSGSQRRVPLLKEMQSLCDLHYETSGFYGGTYPLSATVYGTTCGSRLAGVNDFRPYSADNNNTGQNFTIQQAVGVPGSLTFTFNDFLQNDENATHYDCLSEVNGQGTFSNQTATGFTYTAPDDYFGFAILRYIPGNASGQFGNPTYIFVNVLPPPLPSCPNPANSCNLICNGNFENAYGSGEISAINPSTVLLPGWLDSGSSDLYSRSSPNSNYDLPSNQPLAGGLIEVWDSPNVNNNHYMHISGATSGGEGIVQTMNTPIVTGHNYTLVFHVINKPWNTGPIGDANIVIRAHNWPVLSQLNTSTLGDLIYSVNVPDDDQWHTYTHSFMALNNQPQIGIFCQTTINNSVAAFVDDISLFENPILVDAGPDITVCNTPQTYTLSAQTCSYPNLTYSWADANGVIATTATVSVSPTVTTTYTVTVTNTDFNYIGQDEVIINIGSAIATISPSSTSICTGQSVTLNASTATTYTWQPGGQTTSSITVNPSVTTIYTVSTTDAAGCLAQATSTVTVSPSPTVAATSTTTCSGQAVTITSSGASTYLWSTGATTASISVSPTSNTNYTVTGTGTNGCPAQAISTVTVINVPTPVASFTYPRFDNVVNTAVTFTNTSLNAVSYEWDFMDGTVPVTTTSNTIAHPFTTPGYYNVRLIAYNQCGVYDKTASIAYIIPSAGTYTPTPSCLASFNYNNPVTGSGPDFTITGAANWNSGGTIYIKGTLTIKAGGSLTVSNGTTVAFGPQGKVIVEAASGTLARGLLTIDNAKFTGINFTGCGTSGVKMMWQGIEVWGTTAIASQTPQGKINLINGALIEDAHVAVLLGRTRFIQASSTAFSFNAHTAGSNGGIITATNAKFNRNGVSIWFWGENANHFSSIIKNCQFTCNNINGVAANMLDPTTYYLSNPIFKDHNPFYYPAVIGVGATGTKSFTHIFQAFSKGVKMYDNSFDNAVIGVSSSDAAYTLTKSTATNGNTFNRVAFAVRSSQSISSPKAFTVSNNTFLNFTYGVDLNGTQNVRISKNIFNPTLGTPAAGVAYVQGVTLSNSNAYTVVDNQFNNLLMGVQVHNGGNTAALIGYENDGNIFTRCRTGIVTSSNNGMLNIHCNKFENTFANDYGGKNWMISGTLPDQGASFSDQTAPAGNTFNLSTQLNARKEIDANTTPGFKYYPHYELYTQPTMFNSTASTFTIQTPVVAMNSVAAACAPVPCGAGCRLALIERRNKIAELQLEFINVQNNLDKGQTAALLEAIQNNIPVNQLKDMLNDASPLSDVVLKALINKAVPIPPQAFHEIIKRNSPVDELINPHLENKLLHMPPNMAELIRKEQVISEPYRTLTTIKREIMAKENERQLILNEAIDYSLQNDPNSDEIISLLEEETSVEAKRNLVGLYIEKKDYVAAANKLNTLSVQTPEEQAYADLHTIYIDLGNNNKSLWEMSDVQKDKVRQIAAICPEGLAVVNAKAVMAIVLGEQAPECLVNNARIADNSINENVDFMPDANPLMYNNISYLGNNIPNPFAQSTHIPYQLPDGVDEGALQIKDMQGKLLKSVIITKDKASVEIAMNELDNGVYTYSLYINNALVETKRMILMK